jgi:hypothetical protein|tara:strand:- start:844 stop:1419 length:576 start_codon:yes stop_codon:yes gene_type:complete
VTSRKKNLFLIQITIFLVAIALIYDTYRDKNIEKKLFVPIRAETDSEINVFTDIKYSGFDLVGNRYVLNAGKANFKTESPELTNMEKVVANFYLKDDTILTVVSDEGLYNNITRDIDFRKNVKADYLTHSLLSNLLSYSNSKSKLIATGNVRGESIENGEFIADNVEYDLINKTINFSMIGDKQVKIKLKN